MDDVGLHIYMDEIYLRYGGNSKRAKNTRGFWRPVCTATASGDRRLHFMDKHRSSIILKKLVNEYDVNFVDKGKLSFKGWLWLWKEFHSQQNAIRQEALLLKNLS